MSSRRSVLLALPLVAAAAFAACTSRPPAAEPAQPVAKAPPPDAGVPLAEPTEYSQAPVSRKAGRRYFAETGMGDPYAAGIPYPIFLAMMRAFPGKLGKDWAAFDERFGTIARGDKPPVGFHLTTDPNTHVRFLVVNCALCHAAELHLPGGDRVVMGMGNRRLRIHAYDRALVGIARDPRFTPEALAPLVSRVARSQHEAWPMAWRRVMLQKTVENLVQHAKSRGHQLDRLAGALPGRVATIEGFMLALNEHAGTHFKLPKTIGWAKIPDAAKWRWRQTLSWDAASIGSPVTLISEADFAFGVRPAWFESHRFIPTSIDLWLKGFERDLAYPGKIDAGLARRGYAAFEDNCTECHGHYAPPGEPFRLAYHEQVISIARLGTDRARLDAVTPAFVRTVNSLPTTQGLTHTRRSGGYVPPPLNDVWARGLYGHNGQWPSIAVIATPPAERPRRYFVDPDATYDLDHLGTKWRAATPGDKPLGHEYLYDGTKPGFSVAGHPFLARLPDDQKRAVMEYLKTL